MATPWMIDHDMILRVTAAFSATFALLLPLEICSASALSPRRGEEEAPERT